MPHPAHVHRPSMDEAFAEARLAARVAKKNADRQAARDGRRERFLARVSHQDEEMHPSWRGMWRKYRLSHNPISRARAVPDPGTSHPAFFQRLPVPLNPIVAEPEPEPTYEPPFRWGRPTDAQFVRHLQSLEDWMSGMLSNNLLLGHSHHDLPEIYPLLLNAIMVSCVCIPC